MYVDLHVIYSNWHFPFFPSGNTLFQVFAIMPLPATDDYSAIQAYFTAKEWAEISDYEKLRLKNIKENYEMMIEVGE